MKTGKEDKGDISGAPMYCLFENFEFDSKFWEINTWNNQDIYKLNVFGVATEGCSDFFAS